MTRFGLVFILLTANFNLFGQGRFAGNYASLIGKKYKDDTLSFKINGFTHYQSMILSNDLLVSWHASNELDLIVFTQTQKDHHLILDVLQIEHASEYESTMGNCWNNQRQDSHIIALVKFSDEIKEKAIAAWYFDLSKKRLEKYDASKVYCLKD